VGFDLVRGKPGAPPRYRHVRGNLLQGLPFRDGVFDFVHQRFLTAGIPVAEWPGAVRELVRVTRPGGWVELVESTAELRQVGPATQRLIDMLRSMMGSLGLDATDRVFRSLDGYLRDVGLRSVARREIALPVGDWGGRVGSFVATDVRAAGQRLCEAMQARSILSAQEASELLHRSMEEFQKHRVELPIAIAYGRKPA